MVVVVVVVVVVVGFVVVVVVAAAAIVVIVCLLGCLVGWLVLLLLLLWQMLLLLAVLAWWLWLRQRHRWRAGMVWMQRCRSKPRCLQTRYAWRRRRRRLTDASFRSSFVEDCRCDGTQPSANHMKQL